MIRATVERSIYIYVFYWCLCSFSIEISGDMSIDISIDISIDLSTVALIIGEGGNNC